MRSAIRQLITHPVHPLLLLAGVALLAAAVTTSTTVVSLDAALGALARAGASPISRDADFTVSSLGGTDLVLPVTAAAALLLGLLRQWRGALTLVLAVVSTQIAVDLIKTIVERPRPGLNGRVAEASGFSFPSAHSATGMALYATLTLVAARGCHGPLRAAIIAAGAGLVVAIGLSRVLVAAHYPIDVFAGWLTGAALIAASWLLARRIVASTPRAGFA
jgi:undecaprenyl-diphosphatase